MNPIVSDNAKISSNVTFGSHVIINGGCIIEDGVSIGNNCTIEGDVIIREGSVIEHNVVIQGDTEIGYNNHIFSFCSLGAEAQHKKHSSTHGKTVIGNNNVIREFATIHRSTTEAKTLIGNDNYIMAYCHIAHDCKVGSDIVMTNGCNLAGHVRVDDFVNMGLNVLVHQYCKIGSYSMLKMGECVRKDVIPFSLLADDSVRTINLKGLKRRGIHFKDILRIRNLFKLLAKDKQAEIDDEDALFKVVAGFLKENSARGIYFPVLKQFSP